MKHQLIVFSACGLLIACSNNNAAPETTIAQTKQQPETASSTGTNQPSGDGIVGVWKLTLECYDDNGNKTPDDAERKKGFKNNYSFRFNTDGSCQIQQVYKGRYEVKTEGDKKMLYVYRNRIVGEEEKDPPPDIYRITSMSKNELVLLEDIGNRAFWIFERVS
jgi:hypothetical protein